MTSDDTSSEIPLNIYFIFFFCCSVIVTSKKDSYFNLKTNGLNNPVRCETFWTSHFLLACEFRMCPLFFKSNDASDD